MLLGDKGTITPFSNFVCNIHIVFPRLDAAATDYFRLSAVQLQFEGSHDLMAATISNVHTLVTLLHYIIVHVHVTWPRLVSVHLNGKVVSEIANKRLSSHLQE